MVHGSTLAVRELALPTPSWGRMVEQSSRFMQLSALPLLWPSVAISLTVLAFNLLGDGLRDLLDPRLRGRSSARPLIVGPRRLPYAPRMPGLAAWKAADLLTAVFLLGLIVLALLCRNRLKHPATLLITYLVLSTLQAAISLGRALGLPPLLPAFFPTVPVLVIYATLGFIPELNPRDRDPVLSGLDRTLFRVDPSVWLERCARPWITEVMQLAYLAYYVLPFVLLGILYRRGEEQAFDRCVVALLLSHYLAFIGYLAVPALGPRFLLAGEYRTELPGLLIAEPIRAVLNALEGVKRDAFPSGHTSAILITVFYAARFTPELVPWFAPIAGLMILSTLYLRYHYAVDVLAGALLAALCVLLTPRLS